MPPGFLASREIQQLAETLAKRGDYEGGGGRVDRDIAAGVFESADESSSRRRARRRSQRVSASKRAVTANVEAGLAGRSPAGGTRGPRPGGGRGGVRAAAGTGRARRDARDAAPVTSGSQTMSLNAHAWTGYD